MRGHEERAGGGQKLAVAVAVDGDAVDQAGRGRRRNGEGAVRHGDGAAAEVERRGHEAVGPKPGQAAHASDNVHDRVDGADLVESDLFG